MGQGDIDAESVARDRLEHSKAFGERGRDRDVARIAKNARDPAGTERRHSPPTQVVHRQLSYRARNQRRCQREAPRSRVRPLPRRQHRLHRRGRRQDTARLDRQLVDDHVRAAARRRDDEFHPALPGDPRRRCRPQDRRRPSLLSSTRHSEWHRSDQRARYCSRRTHRRRRGVMVRTPTAKRTPRTRCHALSVESAGPWFREVNVDRMATPFVPSLGIEQRPRRAMDVRRRARSVLQGHAQR